jgi:serine/threonine protein kinase
MTTVVACPKETELLVLAMGDPVAEQVMAHVERCVSCRTRLDRLRAEVAHLRAHAPEALLLPAISPSTLRGPKLGSADVSGSIDHSGATANWESRDAADDSASACRTDPGNGGEGSASPEAPLPAAIGRYLVVGRFPESGQAEVFRVVHPQFQQERVLKLAREPVGLDGRSEIVEEGKILSELEHPHLVRAYDLDFLGDRPYLVMEYIRGRNLEQIASENQVAPRLAAALVAKVAGAAAFAHRRGIVHRDIKPKNILVDETGEPRLIDFGMARLRTAWSDHRQEPSGGTFAFMAPEQARIESPEDRRRVGPRSDVFALGAVLYFLLTGKAPFHGKSRNEAWERARLCEYDTAALNDPEVPARLRRICLKAMAAEPADRYVSAEALAEALESYLRRPLLLVVFALVVLVPAVAVGAWSRWPSPTPSANSSDVIPHPAPASTALAGELTVRVRWERDGRKQEQELKAGDSSGLPLRPGEHVRLEARLNQPAYPYILWVDGQGHTSLLYPRNDTKYGNTPSGGLARATVQSPEALDEWHRMSGPGGLDTVLLLVRRKPLPAGTDLAALVGPLPPSPLRAELAFATRGLDEGQPIEALRAGQPRGIAEQADKIDDPVLKLMERLRTQNQFEVVKAAQFAYRGE